MTNKTNLEPAQRPNWFYKPDPIDRARRYGDIVIALVMLSIVAPLFLLVAVAIKFDGPGPVFVRRTYVGRRGRFERFSFRTTVHDPENSTPIWAQRLRPIGAFLQFARIDSLPQIVNVLRGELSFTDPAADLPSFLEE